jgi:starvation-inducible outer membrane lipoprotein
MKTKVVVLGLLALTALAFQGCVAFPPLIQVEHKESASNQEVLKRLDAIDSRLNQLEQKQQPKPSP